MSVKLHSSSDCNVLLLTGEFSANSGCINKDSVIKLLRNTNANKRLVVVINSPGGDLSQAFGIANAITCYVEENKSEDPILYINKQAQSAASVLSSLFDEVYIERKAVYMLHSVSCSLEDNFEPITAQQVLKVLEQYNTIISHCYGAKSGHPPQAFNSIIDKRVWGSSGELRMTGAGSGEMNLTDYMVEDIDEFFKVTGLTKPSTLNLGK